MHCSSSLAVGCVGRKSHTPEFVLVRQSVNPGRPPIFLMQRLLHRVTTQRTLKPQALPRLFSTRNCENENTPTPLALRLAAQIKAIPPFTRLTSRTNTRCLSPST